MPEITLLDCECTSQTNNNMICQVNNDDNRVSRLLSYPTDKIGEKIFYYYYFLSDISNRSDIHFFNFLVIVVELSVFLDNSSVRFDKYNSICNYD